MKQLWNLMYSFFIIPSVFIVRNDMKLVVLLVWSLFTRVSTGSLRRLSVSTENGNQIDSSKAHIRSKCKLILYSA